MQREQMHVNGGDETTEAALGQSPAPLLRPARTRRPTAAALSETLYVLPAVVERPDATRNLATSELIDTAARLLRNGA